MMVGDEGDGEGEEMKQAATANKQAPKKIQLGEKIKDRKGSLPLN